MSLSTQQLIQKFQGEDNPGHLLQLAEAIGREPLIRYLESLYGREQAAIFMKLVMARNHAVFMRLQNPDPPTLH